MGVLQFKAVSPSMVSFNYFGLSVLGGVIAFVGSYLILFPGLAG